MSITVQLKIFGTSAADTIVNSQKSTEMAYSCREKTTALWPSSAKSLKYILVNIIFVYYICILIDTYQIILVINFFNLKNYFINFLSIPISLTSL